ncbi:uncharacterized protein PHALS_06006 [Plasmopara halstedii]|uniref:Uncharacterized protein n=1 Tax=Plasmopara halstedii TaxID=4781 RepID=A0A0P1AC30_PLAHL|nr:uncharacterized protein PHALS_06006 [Plasmopara halstedii]CEG37961.1 hypothetical protein PHALS_06006 [Plasmopara halstedii]|eukprot:XP_024574330.1 hypothetical protein PHALS_06006 [Plasmopara halstedii]
MGHTRYVFALSKYFDNVGRCIALDLDSMKTSSPFWHATHKHPSGALDTGLYNLVSNVVVEDLSGTGKPDYHKVRRTQEVEIMSRGL